MDASEFGSAASSLSAQLMTVGEGDIGIPINEVLASEAHWMQTYARRVRESLAQAARNQLEAGRYLAELKAGLDHGDWLPFLAREFAFSERTANRYVLAFAYVVQHVGQEYIEQLDQPVSVLYLLAGSGMPEPIKAEAGAMMRAGRRLTLAMVDSMAREVTETRFRLEALEGASDHVRLLAGHYELDSDVITSLVRVEEKLPDTFGEIIASGCIHDYNGRAIPLTQVSSREIQTYANQVSMEAAIRARLEAQGGDLSQSPSANTEPGLNVLIVLDDERPKSLNKFYQGVHWRERNEERDRVKPQVLAALREQRAAHDIVGHRVHILIRVFFKGPDIDPDNIAAKPYIDALKGELIEDDTREFVGRVSKESHHDKGRPRVEMRITPYREPLEGEIVE